MILTLVGFKVVVDKEDNELIKSYLLCFSRHSAFNSNFEYGNLTKNFYVFPNQVDGVDLKVGQDYNVFSVYDSNAKKELFAGMVKNNEEK